MIVFVGDKPSKRTDPKVPFKGAACQPRLMEWVKEITSEQVILLVNKDDIILSAYLTLVIICPGQHKLIALGNNASKRLKEFPHFKLPHPSGRNRQINNKEFIANKLLECKKYLRSNNV